ncbi:MAG: histidine kinase [Bacteroidota bacterium]|nr:histidine kinase [Bacteroidota bacterium]
MQDSKGYIWFGTDKGACRFDGTRFEIFTVAEGLSDNSVLGMIEDKMGRIWFRTMNGKLCYYENNRISNSSNEPLLKNKDLEGYIAHAINDSFGNTWLIATKGCKIRNNKIETFGSADFEKYKMPNVPDESDPFKPWIDEFGRMSFLADSSKVWYFDKTFKQGMGGLPPNENWTESYSLFPSRKGLILITESCLYFSDFTSIKKVAYFPVKLNVSRILEDKSGDLLVSSNRGIFIYSSEFELKNKMLGDYNITNCFRDKEGNLWAGTYSHGLLLLPELNLKVFDNKFFGGNVVSRISATEKHYLAGTADGQLYQFNEIGAHRLFAPDRHAVPYDLVCKKKHYYYILQHKVISSDNKIVPFKKGFFKTGYLSKRGIFYAAGFEIIEFHPKGKRIRHTLENNPYRIYGLAEEKNKIIAGTEKGLFYFQDEKLVPLKGNEHYNAPVNMMRASDDSTIWIASRTEGVLVKSGDSILSLRRKYGMEHEISRLCIDGNKVFAVGTYSVYRIDFVKANGFVKIKEIRKLPYQPPMLIYDVFVKAGNLWIATENGVIQYPVDITNQPNHETRLLISKIYINHEEKRIGKTYDLNHEQNNINISFTGISFRSFGKINYRYRIDNVDTEWTYTSIPNVSFASLSPDIYHFEVQAENLNDTWNTQSQVLDFYIHPPVWKEIWFMLLVVGFLSLAPIGFIWQRIVTIRKEEQLKTESLKVELRALRSQMNPHFVFNALNSIQDFVLKQKKMEASIYLSDFALLMRMTLENARREQLPLSDEINFLTRYIEMEKLRCNHSFQFGVEVDADIDTPECEFPSMLLQPFIENAIHHGLCGKRNGSLILSFKKRSNNLLCSIEDNGCGRVKAGLQKPSGHKSAAMDIIESRIEKYNSEGSFKIVLNIEDLTNANGMASGTKIILNFIGYFS